MNWKTISIEDKPIFDQYLKQGQYRIADLSFTNLFIWRDCYGVRWTEAEGFLVIEPHKGEDYWILPPLGDYKTHDVKPLLDRLAKEYEDRGLTLEICGIPDELLPYFTALDGFGELEEMRDLFDYCYSGESLRELAGRKYHGKRNHISNFRKNHPDFIYRRMTKEDVPALKIYLEEWCRQKECQGKFDEGMICEGKAIKEGLEYMDQLDYVGAIIELDGSIQAFTMGEWLNDNTVVVHVEKANGDIAGLYPIMNQLFQQNEWPDAEYVNREEDTGDEGLRKAKESYYPVELIRKLKGVYRNGECNLPSGKAE